MWKHLGVTDRRNRRPLLGGMSILAIGGLVLGTVLLVSLFGGVFGFLKNPFKTEEVDRTGPALLTAVQNLARVEGSSGTFQVVVDIEKDAKYLPDTLKGQRIIYLAHGSASGTVDLSGLDASAMTIDETTKSVTFRIPQAQINNVRIDLSKSRVLSYDRGLLDRLGGLVREGVVMPAELTTRAEQQLTQAAAESDLRARAQANTEQVLRSIASGLGYPNVTIELIGPQPGDG
jgi:hypothetical protein